MNLRINTTMKKFLSNFDEYSITPAKISYIEHRSECIPYYGAYYSEEHGGICLGGAYLPLFTAPMACLVDENNYLKFDNQGINPIIPRTVSFEKRLDLLNKAVWIAVGLDEFEKIISDYDSFTEEVYICVDVANGHMKRLHAICRNAKDKFGDKLILMTGNVANCETYDEYAKMGIDYIRIGIGSGNGCATNDKTGIGFNMFGLLMQIASRKRCIEGDFSRSAWPRYKSVPKIIFDGGCQSIRDVIIALAGGADYVMCGKIFTQAKEACGEIIPKLVETTIEKSKWEYGKEEDEDFVPYEYLVDVVEKKLVDGRMYYGMSTERAQREMGATKIKYSEGKEYWVPIKYTLSEWVSEFVSAISSTMSYCNCKTLEEFIGKVTVRQSSQW